ncbi:MAG: hypothetical protein HC817_02745 [Saprospiraceae bacterium]|nr:hypothetical protein [Saprospiraceae bacterium]
MQNYEIPEIVRGHAFSIDAFPLKDATGEVSRIAVFMHNISDLKKVEAELREALKKERALGETQNPVRFDGFA